MMSEKTNTPATDTQSPGPTPTDIAILASQLAIASKGACPVEHLSQAFELWEKSARFLAERRRNERKALVKRAGICLWDTISFEDIIAFKYMPKAVGGKSVSGFVSSTRGVLNALEQYFRAAKPVPLGKTSKAASRKWLEQIRQEKAMPYHLFADLLRWRSKNLKGLPQSPISEARGKVG